MAGYVPGGFGRNSHIPAVRDPFLDSELLLSISIDNPKSALNVEHGKQRHLTAVETRLHLLESVLGTIFPNGDMQNISRELLVGDSAKDLISTNRECDPLCGDSNLPTNELLFDDFIDMNQFIDPGLQLPLPITTGDQSQPRALSSASKSTIDQESQFVDNYFKHYHTLYPILHEMTFRSMQSSQTNLSHWPVLANMVLAIGAWLSHEAHQGLDNMYFATAEKHLEKSSVENQGTLTLVQGLVLLSDFAQKQGSPEKSRRYIGSAVQMSIILNLHIEPRDPESTELEKEIRRRIWWSVYCAESCSAKIYGQPLLLPEDALITVKSVSNIPENTLTSSTASFPPQSDESTIYMGLIQQSSYHRLANRIYRLILSSPDFTAQQVQEAEEMINEWHKESSLCLQMNNPSSAPDWYLTARRRQVLCDRSLRLLIHRPPLLRWLKRKSIDGESSTSDHPDEAQCRAQGLKTARTTIDMISDSFASGRYSKLTLSFTLYALFHALIVPLIHIKADPSAPSSITCMQDIRKANDVLQNLPTKLDVLSQSFVVAIKQLCSVSSESVPEFEDDSRKPEGKKAINPHDVRSSTNNIFGNQELDLLRTKDLNSSDGLDFSEWINS